MPREATSGEGFPDRWQCGDLSLALSYEFAPGSPRDGVSMRIPIEVLERVSDKGTDWLVPGMREDLLTEAIRALPKGVRRLLAPAPDVAASVARWIEQAGDEPAEAIAESADAHADAAGTGTRADGNAGSGTGAAKRGGQKAAAQADDPDPLSLDAAMGRLAAWGATSGRVSTRNSPKKATQKKAPKETPAPAQQGADTPASETPKPRPLTEGSVLEALAHAVRVLRGVDLSEADLAHARAHLPDHLRMTFVVTDASGKELGAGKDLAYLQRTLASDANKAVRTAVRAALEEAGEKQARRNKRGRGTSQKTAARGGEDSSTSASASNKGAQSAPNEGAQSAPGGAHTPKDAQASSPDPAFHADGVTQMPTLPRSITQTSGSMTLRAFPALVPQGSAATPAAGVRVMASAAEADREHRAGLARLLLSRIALATNRVTTRWTGREALMLAASPYADTAALVADAQLASTLSLVDELSTPADVRDPEAFETLVAAARDAHEDRVYQILSHVVRALEASAEADAAVRSHPQASLEETTRDVARHGKTLLYEGFVSATPTFALPHLGRYLRAGAVRIERAASSPGALGRDLEDMDRIHQAEAEIATTREALERRPYDARRDAALTQARWMAEELRVSMFAQTLGTPNKVSMKRLLGVLAGAR